MQSMDNIGDEIKRIRNDQNGVEKVSEKGEISTQNEGNKRNRKYSDVSETKSENDIHSPEAKKLRNVSNEKMATIDMINKDLAVVYITRVLSKLEIDTDDVRVKELINCYSPLMGGDFDMMKRHMFDTSDRWEDKDIAFKTAIKYILNDNESEFENSNIDHLAETLLSAIENRMPKFCKDCSMWYIVDRDNIPKMHCAWCKVGIHDCQQPTVMQEMHGMMWFCGKCHELFTDQIQPKMRKIKNIIFEGFTGNEQQEKNIQEVISEINIENNKEKEKDVDKEIIVISHINSNEKKDGANTAEKKDKKR